MLMHKIAIPLFIALLFCCGSAFGEEIQVAENIQVNIFLKILTYDRTLTEAKRDEIRIGILYSPKSEESGKNRKAICESLRANADKTISGLLFSFVNIEFTSAAHLDSVMTAERLNVLYIAAGNAKNVKEIIRLSQKHGALTIAGVEEYVYEGITISLGIEEHRPQIIINLTSANAEGQHFSSNLLKLCKTIK